MLEFPQSSAHQEIRSCGGPVCVPLNKGPGAKRLVSPHCSELSYAKDAVYEWLSLLTDFQVPRFPSAFRGSDSPFQGVSVLL